MAWLVKIAARAQRDLAQLYEDMDASDEGAAQKWYRGLRDAILTLEEMPQRCPVVRQKNKIRQLLYGHKPHVYLVLYRIREKQREVDVLHVRHGARRPFSATKLEPGSAAAPRSKK